MERARVIQGAQWGDEGKGKVADEFAEDADMVARYNGGQNAGHVSVVEGQEELTSHVIPVGLDRETVERVVIGNGVLVNPVSFIEERDVLLGRGIDASEQRLVVSRGAHLVLPHHIELDKIREASNGRQGSTKTGISFVAADKARRIGMQAASIEFDQERVREAVVEGLKLTNQQGLEITEDFEVTDPEQAADEYLASCAELLPHLGDTALMLSYELRKGKSLLAEGAQSFGLDIDHGDYPDVTSTATTAMGAAQGLGISPHHIDDITSVAKALPSRVGGRRFVTKINDEELASRIIGPDGAIDGERGKTTGRIRSVGFLDLVQLRRSSVITGADEIYLTKVDKLEELEDLGHIPVAVEYRYPDGRSEKVAPDNCYELAQAVPVYREFPLWEGPLGNPKEWNELPDELLRLVWFISDYVGVKITKVGTGPFRGQNVFIPQPDYK